METFDPGRLRAPDEVILNGQSIRLGDPIVTVRETLMAAGLTPASEHQVVLVENGRTHLLETDDKLVIADHPHAELRAFRSGEAFGFTLNEVGQVWGSDQMETDELLRIWPPPSGQDWVLERVEEPDIILRPSGSISFGPTGVEHIVARPHHGPDKLLVTVLTLSGVFPAEGALRVESSEAISSVLSRAAKALNLTDTSNWVVSVAERDIPISASFAQAGLAGAVELDWMPREGGGGHA